MRTLTKVMLCYTVQHVLSQILLKALLWLPWIKHPLKYIFMAFNVLHESVYFLSTWYLYSGICLSFFSLISLTSQSPASSYLWAPQISLKAACRSPAAIHISEAEYVLCTAQGCQDTALQHCRLLLTSEVEVLQNLLTGWGETAGSLYECINHHQLKVCQGILFSPQYFVDLGTAFYLMPLCCIND